MQLSKPYLLFLGDATSYLDCKTAAGLRDWCRADVVGQYALPAGSVDLGLPSLAPAQAAAQGARSLVIGVAPVGGAIREAWWPTLFAALEAGLDLVSGMHTRLAEIPELAATAARLGRRLFDVRHADRRYAAATGLKRPGRRVLTVGMDCAIGKKYTALALAQALTARGAAATFRATGQTGIMIAGRGVAIDAVVADFIAGAAEWLSPANAPDHWDVVEGQGSLFHPAYAGVTLGLVHGTQPDALVLCHDPRRTTIDGYPHCPLPPLEEAMRQYVTAASVTNPQVRCIGLSLDTSALDEPRRAALCAALEARHGLPVIDPIRDGAGRLAAVLLSEFPCGARLGLGLESWQYRRPFRVARGADAALDVVVATLHDDAGHVGRGEAAGVDYDGETAASMVRQIETVRSAVEAGIGRDALALASPPGGARNALDCALWDLEAKRAGRRAWELAGIDAPRGARHLRHAGSRRRRRDRRRRARVPRLARAQGQGRCDPARRRAAPRAPRGAAGGTARRPEPVLDPADCCNELDGELAALGVVLLEQPVPRGEDASLRGYRGRIRLAADESVADRRSLLASRGHLRRDQYQARQVRRADRGAGARARGTRTRPVGHGRLHGRHLARDGAGHGRRAARGVRRPGWPAAARCGPGRADPLRPWNDAAAGCATVGLKPMSAMGLWLGIDTGGTFTDAVLLAEGRRVVASAKALTTHWNLAIGIGNAIRAVLDGAAARASRGDVEPGLGVDHARDQRGGRESLQSGLHAAHRLRRRRWWSAPA